MNLIRICKAFQTCGLLLQRSSGLYREHVKTFNFQIARNYCSTSVTDNHMSTLKDQNAMEGYSVESLVHDIKSSIKLKHGPRYDYVFQDFNMVVEYLMECEDVNQDRLLRLFTMQPSLCQHYSDKWKNSLNILHGNGLSMSEILHILERRPQILKRDPVKMDNVFICLREHNFANNHLLKLISKAPELLEQDASFIGRRIAQLMKLFTQKDILKLAVNSPQVLLDDFEDIEEKVHYIIHKIGVDQKHIVSKNALCHPLKHIMLRHEIMLRTGMYRTPHPKKKIENPSLSDMLDTPTKKLTADICKISMSEYRVFEKMLEREIAKEKEMEGISDSESESEDESEDESEGESEDESEDESKKL